MLHIRPYVAGLWVGLVCVYAVPPRNIGVWKYALLGATMSIAHPLIIFLFGHR
jgi:hypothetical protein